MWFRSSGLPFVLPPKHAAVFSKVAALFKGYADEQVLLLATKALLEPETEPPPVTDLLVRTVFAIYKHIQTLIEAEISENKATTMRRMVLAAVKELRYWDKADQVPPRPYNNDRGKWSHLVKVLRAEVAEDDEFDNLPPGPPLHAKPSLRPPAPPLQVLSDISRMQLRLDARQDVHVVAVAAPPEVLIRIDLENRYPLYIRFGSPDEIDQFIAMLQFHRAAAWPTPQQSK